MLTCKKLKASNIAPKEGSKGTRITKQNQLEIDTQIASQLQVYEKKLKNNNFHRNILLLNIVI